MQGLFEKIYITIKEFPHLSKVSKKNSHKFDIYYSKSQHSQLAKLSDLYGSDKGEINPDLNPFHWASHSYTDFYEMIFWQFRHHASHVLECGIGTNNPDYDYSMGKEGKPGASLRMWKDYFPKAQIYGLDIDQGALFSEERIQTHQVDQTSSTSIQHFLDSIDKVNFDVIIDDGLHEFHAGICLFENTIERLNTDGVYIIEDIPLSDLSKYADYFSLLAEKYLSRIINLRRPNLNLNDNSLIMITKIND